MFCVLDPLHRGTTHTTLVSTTASRRTSSDEHMTNDSSSEDDSEFVLTCPEGISAFGDLYM